MPLYDVEIPIHRDRSLFVKNVDAIDKKQAIARVAVFIKDAVKQVAIVTSHENGQETISSFLAETSPFSIG